MVRVLAHLFTPRHTNNHRPRIIHPEGFFVLTTIALVFHVLLKTTPTLATSFGTVLGYSSSITATQTFEMVNQEREKQGIPALQLNKKLSQAAVAKANDMFAKQYWAHNAPDGTQPWAFIKNAGYSYSIAGENLARDFGDAKSMVNAWMASPTHKANIVQKKYTETGIAVLDGAYQGVETTLVVQMFGAPSIVPGKVSAKKAPAIAKANVLGTEVAEIKEQTLQIQEESKQPVSATPTTLQRATEQVLAETQSLTPIFSPLQLSKSLFLAMLGLLVLVLFYDMVTAEYKKTIRVVGKNFAHIVLLIAITTAVVMYKGGMLL